PPPPPTLVLTGCADGRAQFWNATKSARLQQFGLQSGIVTAVALTPDGEYILAADDSSDESTVAAQNKSKILAAAADDCNLALSLDQKSAEAFAVRAEVLRLQQDLDGAEQSAFKACTLGYFRDPNSLRILAEVDAARRDFGQAALHAYQAAGLVQD